MFSASLQRLRLREEEAEDIVAEAAAKETTAPGERDAAREEREVAEFEGMSPREQKLLQGQADAFVRAFPTEMAEIPPENVIERVRFGEILQRRAELLARDEGLGSVAGRQRETQIQRIVDRLRNEAGFEEGVPPGAEGQALLDRWRALAEAQVDASAEDAPGEDVRTADLVSAADLAAMSETEISDIESTADAFINEISESTRGLGGIQEELQQATSRQRRVIQPLLLQRVTALWTDPVAPWSEPENRPGVGFTVFGGRPGGDVFADVRSPQEIVDIMMGIN